MLVYADMNSEPVSHFLGYARLARVQAVFWGNPITSGEAIAWFVLFLLKFSLCAGWYLFLLNRQLSCACTDSRGFEPLIDSRHTSFSGILPMLLIVITSAIARSLTSPPFLVTQYVVVGDRKSFDRLFRVCGRDGEPSPHGPLQRRRALLRTGACALGDPSCRLEMRARKSLIFRGVGFTLRIGRLPLLHYLYAFVLPFKPQRRPIV